MKRGFTLLELLVSLVVLGTVGAIAIPNYHSSIEKARVNEAKINLTAIYAAEKLYKSKNGVYWGPGSTSVAAINSNLNLDLSVMDYAEGILVSGNAAGFQAYLKRTGGPTMYRIDQSGIFRQTPGLAGPDPIGGSTGGTVELPCAKCPMAS